MNLNYSVVSLLGVSIITTSLVGCGDSPTKKSTASHDTITSAPPATVETDHEHEHAHPSEGPHHGSLIELGNEQYHAELVHDDVAGSVTIYILDSAAKSAVPIESKELTVNITHEGQGEQFKIPAKAEAGDPTGKSSRFVSDDKELAAELDHEHSSAQLVVTVESTQLRGKIEHAHEHGNEHEHPH